MRDVLRSHFLAAAVAFLSFACSDTPGEDPRRASSSAAVTRGEGGSPFSLDSALTLFRRDLPKVDSLEDAESSIDRLIARFTRSVQRSDTAALRAMVMNRREYAYLYYPTSPFTRAPTKQEPGLQWFLHLEHSQKGASRLLREYGGKSFTILRNECRPPARAEGRNVLWDDCRQTIVVGGDTIITRLFGGVYERDGRFKIFSYSNDL
ncbi:MAG: hypothetical protein ACRENU_16505 [Gemmatimonadaceae bacterium]